MLEYQTEPLSERDHELHVSERRVYHPMPHITVRVFVRKIDEITHIEATRYDDEWPQIAHGNAGLSAVNLTSPAALEETIRSLVTSISIKTIP